MKPTVELELDFRRTIDHPDLGAIKAQWVNFKTRMIALGYTCDEWDDPQTFTLHARFTPPASHARPP